MIIPHSEKIGTAGHPILLLHGWGHSLQSLKPIGQHLSSEAAVHLIDLPGFGQSPPPPEAWDTFQYANCLIAYLDSQGIDKIDILGHSFGGKVALSLAIRYPERIRYLLLMSASGIPRERSFPDQCRINAVRWMGKGCKMVDKITGKQLFQRFFVPRFASLDYKKTSGVMRPTLVMTVNDDLSKHLPSVKARTLILWGKEDTETPVDIAENLHAGIEGSQLFVFPGKGHDLHADCGSHLCSTYILSFLKSSNGSSL